MSCPMSYFTTPLRQQHPLRRLIMPCLMSYFTTPFDFSPPPRSPNTDCSGDHFSDPVVLAVWCKGRIDSSGNAGVVRRDMCGARIKYEEHGKNTLYGWHIDHNVPVSLGGGDNLENLQPLHWRNNLDKSDNFPWSCPIL